MDIAGNYVYSKGYLFLPVSLKRDFLKEEFFYQGERFFLKDEFHISLLCVKNILNEHLEINEERILKAFCEFENKNKSLSFYALSGELRLVKKGERKSIIALCQVSFLEEFFIFLRERLGIQIDTQPTHITLYTLQKNKGIGVNNQQDLENLTSKINFS